jgi:putative FmdB family regulatory protein
MPTYEYKCNACGEKFEKFQSITAAPIKKCPHCGKNAVQRLIGTGAGLIFKGSGFYITDYRSEGYKEKAKAESGGGESKKPEGGTGGESKASEKKESAPAPAASEPKKAAPKPPAKSSDKKSK